MTTAPKTPVDTSGKKPTKPLDKVRHFVLTMPRKK